MPNIWAKAVSHHHARILERIGAHHVVLPEHEMGERLAHLVTGRILNFIESGDDYALVKTLAPQEVIDKTLAEAALGDKYGVTVMSIKRPGEDFTLRHRRHHHLRWRHPHRRRQTRDVETFANLT